jgi:hypothetical protein
MKQIAFVIISLFCLQFNSTAQIKYDTCGYLHKFEGEWRNVNGNDTIRIYLVANRRFSTDHNSISDQLYGWHEYKQGNTIVESNYANRFMPITDVDTISVNSFSIGLRMHNNADCSDTSRQVWGSIVDYNHSMDAKTVTAILDATGLFMTWHQDNGEPIGVRGMTLPRDFILRKQ